MKSSTATGTTATADGIAGASRAGSSAPAYRGRFAPSPNGLLHQGSLLAAVASWLDARAQGGVWLIRIEDIDLPRVVPGAAQAMLDTLACFGLVSDEPVLFQSTRTAAYRTALDQLIAQGHAYGCRCTRGERAGGDACPCRARQFRNDCAWRLRMDTGPIAFEDGIQGPCTFDVAALGDPVLFRRDGLPAYQLAVAVDDDFQRISDVVRGADLLDSTAWQIAVLRRLGKPVPRYAHVPVLTEPGGAKLAKSRRSVPLAGQNPVPLLASTLAFLGLQFDGQLKAATVSDMLGWSVQNWSQARIRGMRAIALLD